MIPGRALHRLAAGVCSAKTLERVVEPAIADLQKEYAAAGVSRAWILLLGYAAILKVIAICALSVSPANDDDRRVLARAFTWSAAIAIGVVALLIALPMYSFDETLRGWYAATTLVPQALPLAIPIGMAFGIALCFSSRPTVSTAKVMLFGAVAGSALSFCILAWAMPAGNRAYKEMTIRVLRGSGYQGTITQPWRAHNEMTLSELRGQIAKFSARGEPRRARDFAFRFHLRFALAAATLSLAVFLLAVPVKHCAMRGLLAFGGCVAYWVLIFTGEWGTRLGYLAPPLGAWLPNLVLIASAVLIALSSDRSFSVVKPSHRH